MIQLKLVPIHMIHPRFSRVHDLGWARNCLIHRILVQSIREEGGSRIPYHRMVQEEANLKDLALDFCNQYLVQVVALQCSKMQRASFIYQSQLIVEAYHGPE